MTSTLRNFAAIAHLRHARRLLVADAISKAGDWILFVAMSALVFRAGGAGALALFSTLRIVVPVVIGPWAGRWGAGMSAKSVMVLTDLGRGALLLVAALVAHATPSVWLLQVLVVGCAVLGAAYVPAERRFQRDAIEEEQRADFNAVIGATGSIVMIAAPAVGGVLLATVGSLWALVIDGASFFVSAALVWSLRANAPTVDEPAEVRGGQASAATTRGGALGMALGVLARDRFVRVCVITQAAACTVAGASLVMFAPIAQRLGTGDEAIGWLASAIGVGSVLGVVLGDSVARGQRLVLGVVSIATMGVVLGALGSSPNLAIALACAVAAGTAANVPEPLYWTSYANRVPERDSGPFYGLVESGITGGFSVGGALLGALTVAVGLSQAAWIVGLGGSLVALVALVLALRERAATHGTATDAARTGGATTGAPSTAGRTEVEEPIGARS